MTAHPAVTSPTTNPGDNSGDLLLTVEARDDLTALISRFTLVSASGLRLPDWTPGSHVTLQLGNGLARQYSLCGDRRDPYRYQVAVLRDGSGRGGSAWVHEHLVPGSELRVSRPRNNFRLTPAEEYLFIAGGIGITPLLPMIDAAARMGVPSSLLYLGHSLERLAFAGELSGRFPELATRVHISSEVGRADLAAVLAEPHLGRKVFACGPESMLDDLAQLTADWPAGEYRAERFSAAQRDGVAPNAPFTLRLNDGGPTVHVAQHESVLAALGRAGVNVLSSCRQGVCGTCELEVLRGSPDHRDSILDETEQAAGDCFFPCVSRALSDELVVKI